MTDFVDYYELLQISPNAELQTIQRVYRMLAARYHPDNPETGNTDTFLLLQEAYRVLCDVEARATYDARWQAQRMQPLPVFEMKDFVVGVDVELNRRLGVLCLLYNRRRTSSDRPGLSLLDLEALMSLPREHLEFTLWYLRDKSYIRPDEDTSEVLITSDGVDFVESNMPANRIVHRLLKAADFSGVWHADGAQPASQATV